MSKRRHVGPLSRERRRDGFAIEGANEVELTRLRERLAALPRHLFATSKASRSRPAASLACRRTARPRSSP